MGSVGCSTAQNAARANRTGERLTPLYNLIGGDTMTPTDITTMISTLGFPIVCCAALFYQNWKLEERHQEEITKLSDVIAANTAALTELSTILKGGKAA